MYDYTLYFNIVMGIVVIVAIKSIFFNRSNRD
jgi:hypothetical protein